MKNPFKNNNLNPFLGHIGVGARYKFVVKDQIVFLKETFLSQIFLVVSLGLIVFYPSSIVVFRGDLIHGGNVAKCILIFFSLLCFPFFMKYFLRLLNNKRLVFDLKKGKKYFHSKSTSHLDDFTLFFTDILEVNILESQFYANKGMVLNYTVEISDRYQKKHHICSSENKKI